MKIAIVGCGALGSYYGAMLARAGRDVHFLLRSDFDAVRRSGVLIRSGNEEFTVHPKAARSPGEIGISDVVFIGLKTTANDQFQILLPPLVGPDTLVVTLQNGLGNEEQLAQLFAPEQIMGGLCFVCLNRISPGVIHHTGSGLVVLGEYKRPPQQRTRDLASAFQQAGVSCKVTDSLDRARWEKLVWNIPFNGLGVAGAARYEALLHPHSSIIDPQAPASVLTTDKLLGDSRWENLVRELMLEVIAIAAALGHEIPVAFAEHQIDRTRAIGAYKASTLVDFERGQPLEMESLFLEPLRRGRAAGASIPRMEALCRVLEYLNPRGK